MIGLAIGCSFFAICIVEQQKSEQGFGDSAAEIADRHCRHYARSIAERAEQCRSQGHSIAPHWTAVVEGGRRGQQNVCLSNDTLITRNESVLVDCQVEILKTACAEFDGAPWLEQGSPCRLK